jgi:hypothetical protein
VHANIYELAGDLCLRMGIKSPLTLYQAQTGNALNASSRIFPERRIWRRPPPNVVPIGHFQKSGKKTLIGLPTCSGSSKARRAKVVISDRYVSIFGVKV